MGKLKVGDRVRCLDSRYSVYGTIGVVARVNGDGYYVEFGQDNPLYHIESELEPVDPCSSEPPTLLDQFAMAALSGVIALDCHASYEDDCAAAYKYAQAMMKAREVQK